MLPGADGRFYHFCSQSRGKEREGMAVYKDGDKWRVIYRYTNYKGERKQTQKRGFATKREAFGMGEGGHAKKRVQR